MQLSCLGPFVRNRNRVKPEAEICFEPTVQEVWCYAGTLRHSISRSHVNITTKDFQKHKKSFITA